MNQTALSDIRILDLSRVLAGPYATMMLADYGAEVIKIEQPNQGDGTRQWGPPWVGGESAYFLSVNRNKKSVTLNLKSEAGKAILKKLVVDADIFIENFKVGAMAKMGLDYDTLSAINPRLIYCSISGYGQTGPYRNRPGYDFVIQAQGGLMSIGGAADGEPQKTGVAIVDITAGLFAVNAILSALHHRGQTGDGQYIDVALLDTQIAWLANVAHNYFATGKTPARHGNAHANIVPYETFETKNGRLALAVGTDEQYHKFCHTIARPDLWDDTRYQTNAGRVAHRDALVPALQDHFRTRPTGEWIDMLLDAGIPIGPINDIPTILNDPQTIAREMVQEIEHATAGTIKQLGPVAKLSATPAQIRTAPPTLGADTTAVLHEYLNFSTADIKTLRDDGVI